MSKRNAIFLATPLFVVAFVALLLAHRWLAADRSLETVRERGVIRVGYAVEAPFAFVGSNKRLTGESVEIAQHVVAEAELGRIEWRQMEFHSLFRELESGDIDVVAGGVFITPDRARHAAFSRPTARVKQGLLVPKGNPLRLHSYEQAARSTARVAVVGGSVEQSMLTHLGLPDQRMVIVPDARSGARAVAAGDVDAYAISAVTIRWWELQDRLNGCEPAAPFCQPSPAKFGTGGYPAFAFRPDDRKLRDTWDRALATFVGSQEHKRLVEPFGIDVSQLPVGLTADQVIEQCTGAAIR